MFYLLHMKIKKTELKKRLERAQHILKSCKLCPRLCRIDRTKGEVGFCKAGRMAKVYSYRQYPGEEPPISAIRGSGVIFFSHCTMRCVYCQNSGFSQDGAGYTVDAEKLSKIMLSLKAGGCHNINLVTPTHYLPQILEALIIAKDGLQNTPIAYNTSGYESDDLLELLDGIVDIFIADMRYSENDLSHAYSMTDNYVEINRRAISRMHRQVGDLVLDGEGAAKSGLIIRHLVLPGLLNNTEDILKYISTKISKDTHISLMSQYMPLYKAKDFPELNRPITSEEYKAACRLMDDLGLKHGWFQNL